MNLKKCSCGHFYDQDKDGVHCPTCRDRSKNQGKDPLPTMPKKASINLSATEKINDGQDEPQVKINESKINKSWLVANNSKKSDEQKTVSVYGMSVANEPVTGWLVCIEGEHYGEDFRLKAGWNFIGRSYEMDVPLMNDVSISRNKHAAIVYDPKRYIFSAVPGESKLLFYVNDDPVLEPKRLDPNDVITIGNTQLKLIPFCSEKFNWNDLQK